MSQTDESRPWDSTAHGPVHGPAHASYSAPPGSSRAIPLLDLITRQSLDEDYQHVAERRRYESPADEGRPAGSRARSVLTIVAVALFGLLVALAAVQTSRNAPIDTASKDQLIQRINTRRASVATLQKQIGALRATTTREEAQYGALGRDLDAVTATQRSLSARAGWASVSGPGVRVRIDDAPGGSSVGQVRDSDLAGLVNGLWQAGASAVSVNGERVTALSALRNSGSVVRINDTSLSPPYTVLALGDTRTLQADFAQTTSGIRLRNITRQFGMAFSMDNEKHLTVPAAPSALLALRQARADRGPLKEKEKP